MLAQSHERKDLPDAGKLMAMSEAKFFATWRSAELSSDEAWLAQLEDLALRRFGPLARFGPLYMWRYTEAYPEETRRRHVLARQ